MAVLRRARNRNRVKKYTISSAILFFAQLIEKLKIQSAFIEELYDFHQDGLSIVCEFIFISSFSLTSHQFIGMRIALTHITNIIIIEIYAIKITGLNMSLNTFDIDI
jgi:hypothetical protein